MRLFWINFNHQYLCFDFLQIRSHEKTIYSLVFQDIGMQFFAFLILLATKLPANLWDWIFCLPKLLEPPKVQNFNSKTKTWLGRLKKIGGKKNLNWVQTNFFVADLCGKRYVTCHFNVILRQKPVKMSRKKEILLF